MPRLTFHGAARTVTGSKYLLEANGARVLIDCGLFQGLKELRLKNWAKLPFDPKGLDCVVLTHAHIDHVGYLPRLVRQGYDRPIYGTPATVELTELMLYDAAKIQESDAEYANRKGFSKHRPALPLYDERDAQRTVKLLKPLSRGAWHGVREPVWIRFRDAGHLLGSCMIDVELRTGARPTRLLFSGDVGRYGAPLYHDPQPPTPCDVLICESTYGDRDHTNGNILDALEKVVQAAIRRGGVMVMASFAVGRAQQLVYLLQVLMRAGRIPAMPTYIDSPMAADATGIYARYKEDHDLSEGQLLGRDGALTVNHVHLARSVDESKGLNNIAGPAVIISSSGMMTSGRILHHLRQRLPDERNTIILGGYQAAGTRGRAMQEGARTIRIHGQDVPVRAAITQIPGLSGHADRGELMRWLRHLAPAPPKMTYLTHGEEPSANALAERIRQELGWAVSVPALGETVEVGENGGGGVGG